MGFSKLFLLLPLFFSAFIFQYSTAQSFNCTSPARCHALVGYITVNNTNLGAIQSLFNVKNLRSLLGANNYPPSTPRNQPVPAKQVVKVPIPCVCSKNTGTSNGVPTYTIQAGDGLYHIAAEIFSRLVVYPQIAAANNISNFDLIETGHTLEIPLPCSCDSVNGEGVVHYAHVVGGGSKLGEIAAEFGTDEATLARINGITPENELKADQPIDVPLKACNSSVKSDSSDFPLLAANGTYLFTANGCVRCTCDSANNWTLHCEPSLSTRSSKWSMCPSMQCEGSGGLTIGNTITSGCNRTTCSYAGFNNSTIFTSLVQDSTCSSSSPSNDGPRISLNIWDFLPVFFLLGYHLFR